MKHEDVLKAADALESIIPLLRHREDYSVSRYGSKVLTNSELNGLEMAAINHLTVIREFLTTEPEGENE